MWLAGCVHFGEISVRLVGSTGKRGAHSWALSGYKGALSVDGLKTTATDATHQQRQPSVQHPNGVTAVDHLVLRSPDGLRTEKAFADIGFDLLKRNSTVRAGVAQSFYRPSQTTIELLSPLKAKVTASAVAPVSVWGLTFVCRDLDETHRCLPQSTRPPWEAVQPGRQITVLKGKVHDITLSVAFMSPHVKHKADEEELRRRAAVQELELHSRKSRL